MSNINLLPPDIKTSLEQKKKNLIVRNLFFKSLWIFVFTLGITAGTWFYLENTARNVDEDLALANEAVSSFGSLETQARKVSEKITAIKTIENGLNHWQNVIAEVQKVMPTGTSLSKLSLNSNSKTRATMTGYAKDKQSIATLRDSLETSEYFEYVDIESASTQDDPKTGTDIETFTLSFSLQKGALDE
jgi:vacuolar-type H+-ATPase subunit I/STV1